MYTIAIVGANGQVGSEVCLSLQAMDGVQVIPICRTPTSSTFLRWYGFECRHGSLEDDACAASLLSGCDLIADFSLPRGLSSDIRLTAGHIIDNIAHHAPPSSRWVYMSTVMALGMGSSSDAIRPYYIARTVYGAWKRAAEKQVLHLGKQTRHEAYVLRLGQVHGAIQPVSQIIQQEIANGQFRYSDGVSIAVFAHAIAKALLSIARGGEKPGRYTLVQDWTERQVYEYYCRLLGKMSDASAYIGPDKFISDSWRQRMLAYMRNQVVNPVLNTLVRNRELLVGNLLGRFPEWERRIGALYSIHRARAEISRFTATQVPLRSPACVSIPGKRLAGAACDTAELDLQCQRVHELLRQIRNGTRRPPLNTSRPHASVGDHNGSL
jgi:nucleoside-diphosphate-sugar epimerase